LSDSSVIRSKGGKIIGGKILEGAYNADELVVKNFYYVNAPSSLMLVQLCQCHPGWMMKDMSSQIHR
jgi:hypothetical protein